MSCGFLRLLCYDHSNELAKTEIDLKRTAGVSGGHGPKGPELEDAQSAILIRRFTSYKHVVKTIALFLDELVKLQKKESERLGMLVGEISKLVPFEVNLLSTVFEYLH